MADYHLKAGAYHLQTKEIKKLFFSTTSFRDCYLLKSLLWAALRREKTIRLDVKDIDFESRRNKVIGKGDKPRSMPIIDEELFNELKYLINSRKKGFVFNKLDGNPLTVIMINYITAKPKSGEKASIKNPKPRLKHINPHIFRHFIAHYLKNNNNK